MIDVYRRGYANHSGFIGRADPVALSRSNGDRMQEKLSSIPLIPRRLLLGNPAQIAPDISPDGSLLSWLAPADGVMNVWYAPSGAPHEAKLLTRLSGRPIAWHKWSPDGRRILFLKDLNGDENYNIHTVDIASGEVRNLTPMPKVAAQIDLVSPDLPRKLFAGLNDRDPQWHDIWEIDLETGERKKLYENTERLGSIQIDWQGKFRLASRANPETGGEDLFRFRGMSLEPWRSIPFEDSLTTSTGAFNRAGTHFAMISSVGRNTSALLRVDAATGEEQVLAADPEADIVNYMIHPETFEVVAAASDPGRLTWTALDPQTAASLNEIKMRFPEDDFAVSSRSRDNSRWIVSVWGPQKPVSYYLADRTTGGINGIFSSRPDLKPYRLAPMKSEHITSRDGLTLHSPSPMAREPGLCGAFGELPRLGGFRKGVSQCGRQGACGQNSRRSHRRRQLGHRRRHRDPGESRDHGMVLRRLFRFCWRNFFSRCLLLLHTRGGNHRTHHASGEYAALLDGLPGAVLPAIRRPAHRRGPRVPAFPLAALQGGQHQKADAHRSRRQRHTLPAAAKRRDCRDDARQRDSCDLRGFPGRRPRVRPP
jgi:hypothetical protein